MFPFDGMQWTFPRFLGVQVRSSGSPALSGMASNFSLSLSFFPILLMLTIFPFHLLWTEQNVTLYHPLSSSGSDGQIWQEPASALFSIFNLLATLIAWSRFRTAIRSVVKHSEFYTDPLLLITNLSAILAINAW